MWLEQHESELRLEPLRTYRIAVDGLARVNSVPGASNFPPIQVMVQCATTRQGISGARVTAFTNFAKSEGDESFTDATGLAHLNLGGDPVAVDKVYVAPPLVGYWGAFQGGGSIETVRC